MQCNTSEKRQKKTKNESQFQFQCNSASIAITGRVEKQQQKDSQNIPEKA